MKRSSKNQIYRRLICYFILFIACLMTIFPMVYMVATAFKGPTHVFEFPPQFIPAEPTTENFVSAWQSNQFDQYFLNSILVTTATTISVVILSSLMSYAFAFLEFPGKRIIFRTLILFMTMPVMILIIPQFELARTLNLIDTLTGLILVYIAQNIPLATFILTGFFKELPEELIEAVRIDGANDWQVLYHIVWPLSKPALATVIIFSSLGAWDEYVWANTIINSSSNRTLPVGIAAFQGVQASNWGLIFAASLIAIVPIIVIFVFMQKYFIKGAIKGAVKG